MELFKSEFERLWKRKLTWVTFVLIPLAIAGASKYYLGSNFKHPVTSPEFISFGNYSFMVFQEVLITLFNIFAILFVCISINEEYRNGEIRMVMIRGYSFKEIYFAKISSIIVTMFIFFVTFFITSNVWGYFAADKLEKVVLFFHSKPASISGAIFYSAKYYFLGFVTTIAIISVSTFISMLCKTSTGAMGACIGFLVVNMIFSKVIEGISTILIKTYGVNTTMIGILEKLYLSTITEIQHIGICILLAERPNLTVWLVTVLLVYIILSTIMSCRWFMKEDHFV